MTHGTHPLLRGAGTALITPFRQDGQLDEPALRRLVSWQIEQGIHYLVPCGTTGEATTLTPAEHRRVVEITADETRGRVPIVAGSGSNDTAKAIELSRQMAAAGATHLLHTSPMYNKPPQRGIIAHFRAIADVVTLPVVLYNVPSRTASNMESETTLALAGHPNIIAVKEASGNISQIGEIIRHRPEGFTVLSGDDALTLAILAEGGDGVISVTSNATPKLISELCMAAARGDFADARALHHRLTPWTNAAFVESNPIPVKAALAMMGMIENVLRLPLVPMLDKHATTMHRTLVDVGAIPA